MATINFAGIGAWSCKDEILASIEHIRINGSFITKIIMWWSGLPKTRERYEAIVSKIVKDPDHKKFWFGQTHKYWADAFTRMVDMNALVALKIPMLVIMGSLDPAIESCDEFVEKGIAANMPITYWRLDGIEHLIAKQRPGILKECIDWLSRILQK